MCTVGAGINGVEGRWITYTEAERYCDFEVAHGGPIDLGYGSRGGVRLSRDHRLCKSGYMAPWTKPNAVIRANRVAIKIMEAIQSFSGGRTGQDRTTKLLGWVKPETRGTFWRSKWGGRGDVIS